MAKPNRRHPDVSMILLGSLLHHEELAEILGRALEDRLTPADAARLKIIINFNSYVLRVYADWFADRLFADAIGAEGRRLGARTKGELKDLIVANPPYRNARIDDLIAHYQRFPEDYYRETPYEGLIFTAGDPPQYVGSRRIKRIRRIAEKCGRRIIDYLLEHIRRRADELAAERAHRRGIPKDQLITPHHEMVEEFTHAERRVLKSIRDGLFVAAMPRFNIDDVVGFRVVTSSQSAGKVDEALAASTDVSIVDEKVFSGDFSGKNRVVAWRLPREELLATPPPAHVCDVFVARGLESDHRRLGALYEEFVRSAAGHVRFEILTLDYEALLESEIGRSMHEEHIRTQRDKAEYTGRLAQNVEWLMIYLFAFAQSPNTEMQEVPIKVRGTYLPDYLFGLLREQFAPESAIVGMPF
jgi:hypothetical protein